MRLQQLLEQKNQIDENAIKQNRERSQDLDPEELVEQRLNEYRKWLSDRKKLLTTIQGILNMGNIGAGSNRLDQLLDKEEDISELLSATRKQGDLFMEFFAEFKNEMSLEQEISYLDTEEDRKKFSRKEKDFQRQASEINRELRQCLREENLIARLHDVVNERKKEETRIKSEAKQREDGLNQEIFDAYDAMKETVSLGFFKDHAKYNNMMDALRDYKKIMSDPSGDEEKEKATSRLVESCTAYLDSHTKDEETKDGGTRKVINGQKSKYGVIRKQAALQILENLKAMSELSHTNVTRQSNANVKAVKFEELKKSLESNAKHEAKAGREKAYADVDKAKDSIRKKRDEAAKKTEKDTFAKGKR